MRIVQVQTQAEAAGAQRISDLVGAGLRARGHEVRTIFMYRKTAAYDHDPHADFVLATRPRGLLGQLHAVVGLFAYLRRARPEAVISFQHYGNIFGTLGGRLGGARRLVANQSGAPYRHGPLGLTTLIDRLMGSLGAYHANVVNSAWTQAQFARYPAAYRRRLHLIPHGVKSPEDGLDRQAARARFGLPADTFLVVTSGRLTRPKNQGVLIEALTGLPGVDLALAGAGPESERLVALAEKTGVGGRVHLVGEVPPERIFAFLAAGDVYAFASLTETFGLAAVEAALAGLPIVSSDLEVMREVLAAEGGEPAALFVPPRDAAGFAAAIARLRREPELMEQLGRRGRSLARKYSPEAMCLAYERLLLGC